LVGLWEQLLPIDIEGLSLGLMLGPMAIANMVATVDHMVHVGLTVLPIIILGKNYASQDAQKCKGT
jgi:hypothetical protein